jgi:hypothetical protein
MASLIERDKVSYKASRIMASLIERDKVSYKASRISEFQAFFAFLRGQHYKGSGGLPIFNNITSNNWQRKVRLVRIYKF